MKKILTLLLILTFISTVSAAGLSISPSSFTINKTQSETATINFSITNNGDNNGDPLDFVNISVDSLHLSMDQIDSILYGETVDVSAVVDGASDFEGDIEILGYYEQNLGKPEETHNLTIDYDSGMSETSIDIIEGDKVNFINNVQGEVKLVNTKTGNTVTYIDEGETYQINFNSPEVFNYHVERIGIRFTEYCVINAQASEGYVTSVDYNPKLNLDLNIEFPSTEISLLLLETEYTIQHDGSKEDILKITNEGSEEAKGIVLSGDWITFSANGFDLGVGESKNVGYTISPEIYSTNDTDKTYQKSIIVNGNFDKVEKQINISIPYAEVDEEDEEDETLEEIMRGRYTDIKAYCAESINKNKDFCVEFRSVDYNYGNSNDTEEDKFAELVRFLVTFSDDLNNVMETTKIQQANQSSEIENISAIQQEIVSLNEETSKEIKGVKEAMGVFVFSVFTLLSLGVLVFLVFKIKKRNTIKQQEIYY